MDETIILQVGVKVLLRNTSGRYLLLRRNPQKYPEVGAQWDIAGGRINPGMPLIENLKREIREETGLSFEDSPRLVAAQDILRVPGRHVVRLTYAGSIEGQPKLDGDHLEFKWFSMEEMRSLSNEEIDVYFKELLDRDLFY